MPGVDCIAEAGVAIGHDRNVHGLHDLRRAFDHFGHRQEAVIGQPQVGDRDTVAAALDGLEARLLDQPRTQRVPGTRHQQKAGRQDQGLEATGGWQFFGQGKSPSLFVPGRLE